MSFSMKMALIVSGLLFIAALSFSAYDSRAEVQREPVGFDIDVIEVLTIGPLPDGDRAYMFRDKVGHECVVVAKGKRRGWRGAGLGVSCKPFDRQSPFPDFVREPEE